jgi:hypothetical protein
MKYNWSDWYKIGDKGKVSAIVDDCYGIYRIRAVKPSGKAIPIPRIGRTDNQGIIYIGRSGHKKKKTYRTLSQRIREFWHENHSGGWTAALSYSYCLNKVKEFKGYKYEVQIMILPDHLIDEYEAKELGIYFKKYGELPPYNYSFPNELKPLLERSDKKS